MTEPRLLREKVLVFFSFFFIKVNQRTRPLMTSLFRLEFDLISFSFSGRGYKSLGGWGRGGGGGGVAPGTVSKSTKSNIWSYIPR